MYSYSLSPRVMVSVTKDVEINPNTVADKDILQYNAAQQVWTNVTRDALGIVLTDLADIGVDPLTLADGQLLQYNATTSTWDNVDLASLGMTLDNLSNVTAPTPASGDFLKWNGTAWVNDAIDLGTDTTGNYVSDVSAGTGVTVTHIPGEGSTATVAIGQAVGTGDSPSFAGVTADSVRVGVTAAGEIDTTAGNLTIDSFTGQTIVDDDLEVTGTLVVTGNNSRIHGLEITAGHTLSFEGATNNGHETTLTVVDPTADHTITLPNATGTVVLDADSIGVLSDVSVSSASIGQLLEHNGTAFVNRAPRPAHLELQTAVNTRKVGPLGTLLTVVPGTNVGSASVIVFKNACSITALSIYLNATYSSATTYDYRLGIYADSNGEPGSLLVDAGTVSIATGATAGFKTITLGSAQSVAANTPVWLVCAATHVGSVPAVIQQAGNLQPYSDYGLSSATHYQAACLGYITGPATALPATWSMASPQTQPIGVAVWATVSVP